MKRRQFLKSSIAAAGLFTLPFTRKASGAEKFIVKKYKSLGKTGLKMSDISFGCGKLQSPSLIARAFSRGINYFDTAPDYGNSEKVLGEAVKKIKKRSRMIIATKFCDAKPYPGHLTLGKKKKDYIHALEKSLRQLNTDYIDFCFVHAMGEEDDKNFENGKKRLFDENMLEAVESLKKSGKMRFLAVSSHGPVTMEKLMLEAVNSGHYSVIMMSFNFLTFPKIPDVMKQAAGKGVGVIAMKTLAGAKKMELDTKSNPFELGAFKWVLKHPELSGLIVTINNVKQLNYYLQASGRKFAAADRIMLNKYANNHTETYCRTGCGECSGSCTAGVAIPVILRHKMYFEDYGMEKRAMAGYAGLNPKADICGSCKEAACDSSCPLWTPCILNDERCS